MVCVLAVLAVEVEREAPVLGEGAQEFREQFHVEGPYLFRHPAEVAREVASRPEVDDDRRELGLAPAVELQAHPDERLRRLSFSTTFTCHLPPGSLQPKHSNG